jgi:4-hydroxy-tetrahydrodipicolinate synthase
VVTPFRPDERIDFTAWETILDHQIAAGVDGVFIAGGQGEFFALDEEERIISLRFAAQHVARRVAVYGNIGCVTTRESVKLAQKAEAEGLDFLVAITPYYLKPTQDELVAHYVEICRAVRLPVLAYNIPERTGIELQPATLRRIAQTCENFVGLKDSTGRLDQLEELTAIGVVFIGRDHMILPALKQGCAGAVTACANVAPKLFVDLYRAFRESRLDEAVRLQALVDPLRQSFALHTFPSVVKEAMMMVGLPAGPCRKPVGRMPDEARLKLRDVLERLEAEGYVRVSSAAVA